uniref:Uncharacterized protein n=1 Tax=Anguilla anguilla TaxID=7936 RepID=A0A0E9QWN6_ANGAN
MSLLLLFPSSCIYSDAGYTGDGLLSISSASLPL